MPILPIVNRGEGSGQLWNSALGSQRVVQSGDTIAGTAATTAFATTYTLPARALETGDTLQLRYRGNVGTAGSNVLFTIDLVANGVVLATNGGVQLAANNPGRGWRGDFLMTAMSTAAVDLEGMVTVSTGTRTIDTYDVSAGSVALDLSVAQTFGLQVTWGTGDPLNTITQRLMVVDMLGLA